MNLSKSMWFMSHSSLQIKEALQIQLDVQMRLHEQLEVYIH